MSERHESPVHPDYEISNVDFAMLTMLIYIRYTTTYITSYTVNTHTSHDHNLKMDEDSYLGYTLQNLYLIKKKSQVLGKQCTIEDHHREELDSQ
jgi:hypothetical protein